MDNTKNCQSPNDSACPKDLTFGESLGMAMVAATGAGAYHVDPLISSAAVAGASSNLDCKKNDASKMVWINMLLTSKFKNIFGAIS